MRMGCAWHLAAGLVVLAPLGAPLSVAVPIGPADFGPGAVFESFEGLPPGPNIPAVDNGAFLRPGESTTYAFPSGVSLTSPIPNPPVHGVRVGDFALGDASSRLLWGQISVSSVPFGTAYLIGGEESSDSPGIEFSFPTDILRVGAYIGGTHNLYVLSAYDAAGTLIETAQGSGPWSTGFIGIQNPRGIRRVAISGYVIDLMVGTRNTLVDGLTFEPLPEPSTLILLLAAVSIARASRPARPASR